MTRPRTQPAGHDLFSVVGQHFCGYPVALHYVGEGGADCSSARAGHDLTADDESGMVSYIGADPGFGAGGQIDPADDVHLPQLHRLRAVPALIAIAFMFAGQRFPAGRRGSESGIPSIATASA